MSKMNTVLATLAMAAWAASPVLAQDATPVDVSKVTCGDFTAMDAAGKLDTTHHVRSWINDEKNAVAAQKLIAKYAEANRPLDKLTEEDMVIEIEGHCKDGAPDAGIMDRLMEHT